MADIENLLIQVAGSENVKLNEQMSKHTSFKTGGPADYFVIIKKIDCLKGVLEISKGNNIPLYILGNGSNILVTDKGIRGIVCKIQINKFDVVEDNGKVFVTVGSGNKIMETSVKLMDMQIEGFEFASGIPGSIGGAVKMNAGAYGKEMKDIVYSTTYMDYDGNIFTLKNDEQKFEYRKSIFSSNKYIILETVLKLKKGNKDEIENKINEYMQSRKEKQPYDKPSAGSTFKRNDGFITAKVIDECGLKGYTIGGAKVSEKHAGFVVNENHATSKDIIELIDHIKKTVYEKTGKQIELEVEIIGER